LGIARRVFSFSDTIRIKPFALSLSKPLSFLLEKGASTGSARTEAQLLTRH